MVVGELPGDHDEVASANKVISVVSRNGGGDGDEENFVVSGCGLDGTNERVVEDLQETHLSSISTIEQSIGGDGGVNKPTHHPGHFTSEDVVIHDSIFCRYKILFKLRFEAQGEEDPYPADVKYKFEEGASRVSMDFKKFNEYIDKAI